MGDSGGKRRGKFTFRHRFFSVVELARFSNAFHQQNHTSPGRTSFLQLSPSLHQLQSAEKGINHFLLQSCDQRQIVLIQFLHCAGVRMLGGRASAFMCISFQDQDLDKSDFDSYSLLLWHSVLCITQVSGPFIAGTRKTIQVHAILVSQPLLCPSTSSIVKMNVTHNPTCEDCTHNYSAHIHDFTSRLMFTNLENTPLPLPHVRL